MNTLGLYMTSKKFEIKTWTTLVVFPGEFRCAPQEARSTDVSNTGRPSFVSIGNPLYEAFSDSPPFLSMVRFLTEMAY